MKKVASYALRVVGGGFFFFEKPVIVGGGGVGEGEICIYTSIHTYICILRFKTVHIQQKVSPPLKNKTVASFFRTQSGPRTGDCRDWGRQTHTRSYLLILRAIFYLPPPPPSLMEELFRI